MSAITVNGKEYAWGQVNVIIPGATVPLDGVFEINYGEEQDKSEIYGRGNKPLTIGPGNKKFSGNVGILQSAFESMTESLGAGKTPLDIIGGIMTVSYGNFDDSVIKTDQIVGVEYTKWQKGGKSGDGNMPIDLPFKALNILLNV